MMLRKLFFYFSLLCIGTTFFACTNSSSEIATIASVLAQGNGTWKVSYAKFGNEEAPTGMYDGFTIQFKSNGAYVVVNPNGAIVPAASLAGKWKQGSMANTVIFDDAVTVREISKVLSNSKVVLEWEVSIPGKVTTTYRIELVRA